MKVSMARIRLFLKEGKTLSDGTNPIMLMVAFNGKCTRSTGYSCTPRFWDKTSECVKRGFANYAVINYEIQRMKNECIARRAEYERLQQPYTAEMIISSKKILSATTNDLKSVIQRYIDDKGLEPRTIEKWWIVYRNVTKYYGREVIVNEIDEAFCRKYGRWMESNGLSHGSIRSYLAKIGAICHYAIGKGLMSEHPFKSWAYHKDYRDSKNELYIHSRTLDIMMEMFLDEVIERDGSRWRYRENAVEQLMDIHSELYGHYLYMIGIWMKGIAPVDISMLKRSDIKVVQIKNINCYAIDGRRSKTGMQYKIRIPQNCVESNVLIRTMLMFGQGEYFLPTLNGYNGKDVKKRINNVYTYHGEHLVKWFQKVNEEIARRNVMNDHKDDIPLIDLECRYYSYRHSFIMKEIQKPTVNLLALAQTVGKSATTLHQYISLLGDVDLI